jgi:hypothetical protein
MASSLFVVGLIAFGVIPPEVLVVGSLLLVGIVMLHGVGLD